jgi:uncharacterized protein with HEPN domain
MSAQRRDNDYLADIQEAIQRVIAYTNELSYQQFLEDTKTQDAVVRNLQVIGEAAKKLSVSLRKAHAHLPWKEMAGLRDKIVHEYFGINYDIVWTVAREELPVLVSEIEDLLSGWVD